MGVYILMYKYTHTDGHGFLDPLMTCTLIIRTGDTNTSLLGKKIIAINYVSYYNIICI